ncbi:MAG TPA: serine/threonine-protein kinase [Gemmatimonadales bacterium]|nr:serine/threonine-protein kinase [Gemmatimonadales bacterium]
MPDPIEALRTALAGRYTVERELGAGGMATVYLAEDVRHRRKVAVKVLRPDLTQSVGPERFLREIEIAARLQHPHILPLYDSGEAGGFLFYVMPYVEGESLRHRLTRQGELPVADAVRILRDVADALAKAHAQGVVHRDIKPDNVLLADRHAMVADFGVAKAVSEATGRHGVTTAGVALGTPAYMAPEQAVADPNLDHRVDIYAFGVLAYEILTGEPPFSGSNAQQILSAHVTEAPAPVTVRRDTVPQPLAELIMRCLQKKPADRWQSAEELVTRLEGIATPSGGVTPTTGVPPVSPARAARRLAIEPRVAGMGAAALAVVAAIVVWAPWTGGGPPADPNLVAVLPFRVVGGEGSMADLREGMVDMIATYLTGEGGTARAADPAAAISAWRARGASESSDLTEADQLALARSLGAGRLLTGSVVGTESRLVFRATLAGVRGGGAPIQATVEGPADSLLHLVPRLVGQLLAQSEGMAADQSASLTTNSLVALRAYLRGQAHYRLGQFGDAVNRYTEALQNDSNFALAGAGLIGANGWIGSATPATIGLAQRTAWRNRELLSARDRALVTAIIGPNGPDPDARVAHLQAAQQATVVAPDRAEAWYYYGDDLFHDGALLGQDDPLGRAEQALQRALRLDSMQSGILQHLTLLAAYRQDTAEVRRLLPRQIAAMGNPWRSAAEQWFAGVFLGDTALRDRALRLMTDSLQGDLDGISMVAFSVPFLTEHTAEAREAIARLRRRAVRQGDRDFVALNQGLLALDMGRPQEANGNFDQISPNAEIPVDAGRVMFGLFWDGDTAQARRAAARLATAAERGDNQPPESRCALALWRLEHGDVGAAATAARRAREVTANRDPTWPPNLAQVCAAVIEAAVAQRAGRSDAGRLIDELDRTLLTLPYRTMSWENLAMARLLEARGEYARAAAAARRFRYFFTYTPFLSTHYREAGRLSELAGQREQAIDAYTRYLALRRDPEPALKPEVDKVRQALARLTGEGRN